MNYLIKESEDRFIKEYRKGNISPKALERLRQSSSFPEIEDKYHYTKYVGKHQDWRRPAVRPIESYIDGINRGTEKMLDSNAKRGYNEYNPDTDTMKHKSFNRVGMKKTLDVDTLYATFPQKRIVRFDINKLHTLSPEDQKEIKALLNLDVNHPKRNRFLDAFYTRHESHEEVSNTNTMRRKKANKKAALLHKERDAELARIRDKYGFGSDEYAKKIDEYWDKIDRAYGKDSHSNRGIMVQPTKESPNGREVVGVHHDLDVLKNEAHLISGIPHPEYTRPVLNMRDETGERPYMRNVLGQDPYTRGVPKNANKLLKTSPYLNTKIVRGNIAHVVPSSPLNFEQVSEKPVSETPKKSGWFKSKIGSALKKIFRR